VIHQGHVRNMRKCVQDWRGWQAGCGRQCVHNFNFRFGPWELGGAADRRHRGMRNAAGIGVLLLCAARVLIGGAQGQAGSRLDDSGRMPELPNFRRAKRLGLPRAKIPRRNSSTSAKPKAPAVARLTFILP
jgi:hypothetical protein